MIFPTFKITTVREKWRHTISSIASSPSVRYQLPFSAALSRSSPAVRPITISAVWVAIADILVNEGYIEKYELVEDGNFKNIHVVLKYGKDKNEKVITGLKKISKPGLRVYANCEDLPHVLGGLGIAIVSTNKGVMTDKEARKLNVGGEVLAFVW